MGLFKRRRTDGVSRPARNGVAVSVALVLAVVLVALGAGGAFLWSRARMPGSFTSTTSPQSVGVEAGVFDDAHAVTVSVPVSGGEDVASPVSGVVTRLDCAAGGQVASGSSCLSVDERPVLMLYLSVPPYRSIAPGDRGRDVAAVNAELRRLGYGAPDSDAWTWDSIAAFNALAGSVGAQGLTREANWTLSPSMFAWLPQASCVVSVLSAAYGRAVNVGDTLFSTSVPPSSVTFSRELQSGTLATGDRSVSIGGQEYVIPDGAGEVSDPAVVSAVLGSQEYATAASSSDASQGVVQVTYQWRLASPLSVVSVPPSSLYDVDGSQGCVAVAGTPVAVSIVASQLGRTMVTVDGGGDAFTSVDVPPSTTKACR